jgi:hypothetical protein
MTDKFQIIDIPNSAYHASKVESLGSKFKFWFEDEFGDRFLFKQGREGSGEDWSEKVSSELCTLLDIPHAHYDFANWLDDSGVSRRGVVTQSFLVGNDILIPGMQILNSQKEPHLEKILSFWEPTSYLSTFIGYLLFDAWIGNTDRHSENWGLVVHVTGGAKEQNRFPASIAPTFDHASSLGVRLSDEERKNRLSTRDKRYSVAAYALKCKSPFSGIISGECRRLKTHEVSHLLASRYPDRVLAWIERFDRIDKNDIENIFTRIPSGVISETEAEFALAFLSENMLKLLSLKGDLK